MIQGTVFFTYICNRFNNSSDKTRRMKTENTIAQMRKGILELCILNILDKKEAYPSEIISELKNSKMIIVEGTLYPLLTRLKNAELLAYRWEESAQGPPRKYYSITEIFQNNHCIPLVCFDLQK